ncbi:ATP-binding cassette domain-containing protein [Clostridium algidicarnis]|uniref:ATP-binding cassette domain-containing protein n=1 Tax=Clostridium algidicarnis TaxID=37659 RepID=UPI001C0BE827|nr:ABC transporter ATP-binding protein [Clostridium algidicarnis]MBU3227205.1 ABC transporter ATP-binding protein/permease [Clostridium algidicarnis]MBU3250730.1 ABC transporter ATP-binding protein/permease [Clostridium algidicarnis]
MIKVSALIEPYLVSVIVASIMQDNISLFKRYIIMFAMYYMVFGIVNYSLDKISSKLMIRINNKVKERIFYSYFGHFQYSNTYNSAKLNNIFTSDYSSPLSYLDYLFGYLSEVIALLSMLFILVKQNTWFIYTIVLVIPIIFINIHYSKKIKKYNKINFYYLDVILGIVKKVSNNIYEIASNEKIKNFIVKDFDDYIEDKIANVDKLNESKINLQYIMDCIMKINIFLFYILAGILIFKKRITPEIFIFLSFYIQKVLISLIGITNLIPTVQTYHVSLDRVFEVMGIKKIFKDEEEKKQSLEYIDKIEIKDGEFKIKDSYILKDVNMHLNKGEHILIEGENGSGKSSMIKLISLQYPLSCGEYLINDNTHKEYKTSDIMECISISNQNPNVYPLAIRNNILYEADNGKYTLNEILEDFDLLDYIESLEDGMDTYIDENYNLSGGQKKKIEIIRCLSKNSSIYILDEPLANLDADFKNKFDYILNKYFSDKTVIMIEHGNYRSDFFDRCYKFKHESLEVQNG